MSSAPNAPAAIEPDIAITHLTEWLLAYGHQLLHPRQGTAVDAPGGLGILGARAVIRLKLVGPMPMGQLASALAVSPARVTQVVDALEREGLVERRRSQADRRVCQIRLKPGRDTCLDARFHEPLLALRRAWAAVPEDSRPAVLDFLERLVSDGAEAGPRIGARPARERWTGQH